ncbi:MAG: oxygen-dependent coproporphyrinogen oxidase [Myxococcaceae bacterium]
MSALRDQAKALVEAVQERWCQALEGADGARFREDVWGREGGGGGRTRVLEDGAVLERAGVNTSAVFGKVSKAMEERLPGDGPEFFATGVSMVLHPRNPHAPTTHANFRYFERGSKAWFGGGSDLTPYYLYEEDVRGFHGAFKAACDLHDPGHYPRFKKACDSYFYLPHRGETRGVGGIFFDELEGDLQATLSLVADCAAAFLPAYLPILERRKDTPYTPEQRTWQELRRGRYVEFNLLYDRGTSFGFESKGRVESILVSMPPRVRWAYDVRPAPGSPEQALLEVLRQPRDWA